MSSEILTSVSTTQATSGLGESERKTVQFEITGTPESVTLILEGSVNSEDWEPLATHVVTDDQLAAGHGMFHVVNKMVSSIRVNLSVLTGGTTPTVTIWLRAR